MILDKKESPQLAQWNRRDLLQLIWPLILERILVVMLGIVDTLMVSTLGEAAVSGVSLVDSINVVLIDMLMSLSTGGAVVSSQYIGRGDPENASNSAKQLIYVVTLVSSAIMGILIFTHGGLLSLIYGNIEANVMENAKIYFLLSAISYPALAIYNAGAALFRSMGNSRVGMGVSLLSNILNIGGNALFIFGFGWGVAGAALSTLICRIISAIIMIVLLALNGGAVSIRGIFRFRFMGRIVSSIMRVGIPAGLEGAMFQIGKLFLARLVTQFGTDAIAGNAIANTIMTLSNMPGIAVSMAILTVVGQCIGAGAFERAKQYAKDLVKVSYAIMTAVNLALILLIPTFLSFLDLSQHTLEVAKNCATMFCVVAIFLWTPSFCFPQALRAAGDGKFSMMVSATTMWCIRVGGAYLLASLGFYVYSVWIAMFCEWVFRGTIFALRWRRGKWMEKQVI